MPCRDGRECHWPSFVPQLFSSKNGTWGCEPGLSWPGRSEEHGMSIAWDPDQNNTLETPGKGKKKNGHKTGLARIFRIWGSKPPISQISLGSVGAARLRSRPMSSMRSASSKTRQDTWAWQPQRSNLSNPHLIGGFKPFAKYCRCQCFLRSSQKG